MAFSYERFSQENAFTGLLVFLAENLLTEIDALIADIDSAWPSDESPYLRLELPAE